MISFQKLAIQNFKSIKKAELVYDKGVWLVTGVNNDAVFDSNGSGKTTTLEAIQQCLFNKTTSPTPIEDTSHKQEGTKKHTTKYELELTFSDGLNTYTVLNSRRFMTIQIFQNGIDLRFKSIPQSLKFIQEVIGMDFQTFVTLTFINHSTITELLDNFSSSALMKVILNFSQIAEFEKKAKVEQKVLLNTTVALQSQIQTIKNSLEALNIYTPVDTSPLNAQKVRALVKIEAVHGRFKSGLQDLNDHIAELTEDVSVKNTELKSLQRKLDDNICATCERPFDMTEEELAALNTRCEELGAQITKIDEKLVDYNKWDAETRTEYTNQLQDAEKELSNAEELLTQAHTKNELYGQAAGHIDSLRTQLADLEVEYVTYQTELNIIQTALSVLKAGDLQKSLIGTFVVVLNSHLVKFMEFSSLDYISISAEANKASVAFKIYDTRFSQAVSIHSLSGGEKTRLRLVVLLAMLYTIQDLAQVSTNLLIFDESLDTLDVSATKDLANLFSYLVANNKKFIALVSHGSQLSEINFTGHIVATKTKGVTSITKEVYD